jgi:membrane protein DedA with SNARE-associated domain
MLSLPTQLGYGALFGLVFAESAGVPVPGETALLTAGVLAGAGQLALPVVIVVAAVAAILGDNLGYWLGRRGGRAVLVRRGPFKDHRMRALERGEAFFDRHGAKTIFVGRFVPGVRVVAAVVAGASAMPWRTFAVYNVAGAFFWATTVAGLAALVGPAGAATFAFVGALIAVAGAAGLALRTRRRRVVRVTPSPKAAS